MTGIMPLAIDVLEYRLLHAIEAYSEDNISNPNFGVATSRKDNEEEKKTNAKQQPRKERGSQDCIINRHKSWGLTPQDGRI